MLQPGGAGLGDRVVRGAVKMLKWAEREHQAYPVAWFYGLVRMMDPSFELLCVNGLNAHSDQEWKRTRKGML